MKILKYTDWEDTALTLHLLLQMLGKVKLARMEPQPEWAHILLQISPEGFSTGLIPNGDKSFAISLNIRESRVSTVSVSGRESSFPLRNGTSVSEYYADFQRMLNDVTCQTVISTIPQEMSITTPFEEIGEKRDYDAAQAAGYFDMCVFAHNTLQKFASPFRGKKIMPSLFWGTFDHTAILYGGKHHPFEQGGIVEKGAFDEQMIEFGFWPGDGAVAEPSFFILPYPFVTEDLSKSGIKPDKAVFSQEKAEFFLSLRDAFSYPNPEAAVLDFLRSGYEIISVHAGWENLEWLNKPLLFAKK